MKMQYKQMMQEERAAFLTETLVDKLDDFFLLNLIIWSVETSNFKRQKKQQKTSLCVITRNEITVPC